jgi:hypothetical protein
MNKKMIGGLSIYQNENKYVDSKITHFVPTFTNNYFLTVDKNFISNLMHDSFLVEVSFDQNEDPIFEKVSETVIINRFKKSIETLFSRYLQKKNEKKEKKEKKESFVYDADVEEMLIGKKNININEYSHNYMYTVFQKLIFNYELDLNNLY